MAFLFSFSFLVSGRAISDEEGETHGKQGRSAFIQTGLGPCGGWSVFSYELFLAESTRNYAGEMGFCVQGAYISPSIFNKYFGHGTLGWF